MREKPEPINDEMNKFPHQHAVSKLRHRARQLRFLWKEHGVDGLLEHVRRIAGARLTPDTMPLPLKAADILACNLTSSRSWPRVKLDRGQPLSINWVTTPPAYGSGGHTTMFRIIESLQRSGNRCRIYLYDARGGDATYYASIVRKLFPGFSGEMADVSNGMSDAHAVVATSWQTAYPVYQNTSAGKRFYLVQDFEPWFYPAGGLSTLAENSYRMGFHAITAGRFLAAKLRNEYGMAADSFDFGCDKDKYHLLNTNPPRNGIVFYAKPQAPRRAFELGIMALRLFAERHPGLKIHFYGDRIKKQQFPFIDHGVLSAAALNEVYNQCFAGLSLSMTNVSLVPHEMLAAGCIPIVNDAEHNRVVLDNKFVRYAPPTPHALAAALDAVVTAHNFDALAQSASASVSTASWETAGFAVERSIRNALREEIF